MSLRDSLFGPRFAPHMCLSQTPLHDSSFTLISTSTFFVSIDTLTKTGGVLGYPTQDPICEIETRVYLLLRFL